MEKPLSPRMKTALGLLPVEPHHAVSAYGVGVSLGTLEALEGRGLARAARGRGAMFSPRTAIKWWLTEAGAALTPKANAS